MQMQLKCAAKEYNQRKEFEIDYITKKSKNHWRYYWTRNDDS